MIDVHVLHQNVNLVFDFLPNYQCSAEGFLLAYSQPLITTGAVVGVGFLGLKSMSSA